MKFSLDKYFRINRLFGYVAGIFVCVVAAGMGIWGAIKGAPEALIMLLFPIIFIPVFILLIRAEYRAMQRKKDDVFTQGYSVEKRRMLVALQNNYALGGVINRNIEQLSNEFSCISKIESYMRGECSEQMRKIINEIEHISLIGDELKSRQDYMVLAINIVIDQCINIMAQQYATKVCTYQPLDEHNRTWQFEQMLGRGLLVEPDIKLLFYYDYEQQSGKRLSEHYQAFVDAVPFSSKYITY